MARIVQKYGGTSVADIERIKAVAQKVAAEVRAGNEVAAVVSAMAGCTSDQSSDDPPVPASRMTVGLPSPMQTMCIWWPLTV